MRHRRNVQGFFRALSSPDSLIGVYNGLVALEISLRDNPGPWNVGHDIFKILTSLPEPGLTGLAVQLRSSLSGVPCSLRDGSLANVDPTNYPGIRYAVFQQDDPASSLVDSQLEIIRTTLNDIFKHPTIQGLLQ